MGKSPQRFTDKQELWYRAYIGPARFNATEAARVAGYKDPEQAGFENKKNQALRARIDEELDALSASSSEVLAHIAEIATAEWDRFQVIRYDPKTGEVSETRFDLGDKVKALELLGKHHQLFTDKVNIGGDFLDVLKAFGRGN